MQDLSQIRWQAAQLHAALTTRQEQNPHLQKAARLQAEVELELSKAIDEKREDN